MRFSSWVMTVPFFSDSDRIITLYEGEITGQFRTDAISKEELGYYMTGARREEEKTHG